VWSVVKGVVVPGFLGPCKCWSRTGKFAVALSGPSYCRHADFESGVAATARHLSTKQQPSIRNPIASAQGRAFPTGPGESGQRQTKRERERKGDKEMPGRLDHPHPPQMSY
jgi:hypothetical protein